MIFLLLELEFETRVEASSKQFAFRKYFCTYLFSIINIVLNKICPFLNNQEILRSI